MKYAITKTDLPLSDLQPFSELHSLNRLIVDSVREINKRKEGQIIDRLAQQGITFSNRQELEEFAKTRLTIATYQDKPEWRELLLDKTILIASWWETIDFDKDTNTITCGKHPNECTGFKL